MKKKIEFFHYIAEHQIILVQFHLNAYTGCPGFQNIVYKENMNMHMLNVLNVQHIRFKEIKYKNELNFNGIHATKLLSTVIDVSKKYISSRRTNYSRFLVQIVIK